MGPDSYQQNWHQAAWTGAPLELLVGYGAIVLVALLVAGAIWWSRRRADRQLTGGRRGVRSDAWPTAMLTRAPKTMGSRQLGGDEGRLRASHVDRERAVTLLRDATADGYLTLEEFEERLGAVYSARYLGDLDPLVADIPGHPLPAGRHPVHAGWSPPVRHQPAFGAVGLLFVVALAAAAMHMWIFPAWPLLLLVFIAFRLSRHRRHLAGRSGWRA